MPLHQGLPLPAASGFSLLRGDSLLLVSSAERKGYQADTPFGRPANALCLSTRAGPREQLPDTSKGPQQQSAGRTAAGTALDPISQSLQHENLSIPLIPMT